MAVPSRRFERALHLGWKESFATFGLRKRTAQPRVLPRIRAVYRVEQLLSCKVCSHYPPRSPLVEQQGPRDSAFDLSRFLLEGPLETALPAPFDDHQQPRSSDYLRLEHRANFIPIESGASRSVYFFSFLFFSLSLSFPPFFRVFSPLSGPVTLAGRFWSPGHEFYEFTDSVNRDLLSEWRLFLRPSRTYVAAPTMGQRAASTPQALRLVGARTTMPPSEHRKGNTCQNGRHTFVPSFARSFHSSFCLSPFPLVFVFPSQRRYFSSRSFIFSNSNLYE